LTHPLSLPKLVSYTLLNKLFSEAVMRFLITSKSIHPIPPDMVMPTFQAMKAWTQDLLKKKKMEQGWGFAGQAAGGGILNVNSFEELDAILARYPFGPFSDTQVYPLVDLIPSIDEAMKAIQEAIAQQPR
jgi:muconolactone delta-isomerase